MPVPIYAAQSLLRRYPLSEWLPYRAYDDKGRVFWLDDGRAGVVWESPPLLGLSEDVLAKLLTLFELDLPPGTTLQLALHASPVVEHVLDRYVALRAGASPVLKAEAERQRAYTNERRARWIASSGLPLRDFLCYVSVTLPIAIRPGQGGLPQEDLDDKLNSLEQLLVSCGLHPTRLDAQAFLRLLHLLLNPGHDPAQAPVTYDPLQSLADQAVRPDTVLHVGPSSLELDGRVLKTLTVQQFPERWHGSRNRELVGSVVRMLDQITVPFWITLNTVRVDYTNSISVIRQKHLLVTQQSRTGLTGVVPLLKRKKEHLDIMVQALADGRQPIGLYYQVVLYAPNRETAERQSQAIQALYRSLDWQLQEDHYIGLSLFLMGLPMGVSSDLKLMRNSLRRLKTVHTGVAPHLCPIVADWKGVGDAVMLLSTRGGQMLHLDLFGNPSGNYNVCIAARTGSGKSFFANELIHSYLGLGAQIWMIDAGRSYEKLCEQVGGQFIKFSKQLDDLQLNPLATAVERDLDELAMLKAIFAQMASPSRALTDLEMAWMEQALTHVLDAQGTHGTPSDVARVLLEGDDPRHRDLGHMLYPYTTSGTYGRLFNGTSSLRFDAAFSVLELDGLDTLPEMRSVLLLQVLMAIQAAMYGGPRSRPKICGMDEAWNLLSQGGNTATFFEKGVRRVRKYGGSILTITQGINDYYDKMGQVGAVMLENSDFVILLQQRAESLEALKARKRLVLSDYEFDLLNGLHMLKGEYSELFVYTPVGRTIARLVVDRSTQLAYSTTPQEQARIEMLRERGLSTEDAIKAIIQEEVRAHR